MLSVDGTGGNSFPGSGQNSSSAHILAVEYHWGGTSCAGLTLHAVG